MCPLSTRVSIVNSIKFSSSSILGSHTHRCRSPRHIHTYTHSHTHTLSLSLVFFLALSQLLPCSGTLKTASCTQSAKCFTSSVRSIRLAPQRMQHIHRSRRLEQAATAVAVAFHTVRRSQFAFSRQRSWDSVLHSLHSAHTHIKSLRNTLFPSFPIHIHTIFATRHSVGRTERRTSVSLPTVCLSICLTLLAASTSSLVSSVIVLPCLLVRVFSSVLVYFASSFRKRERAT